MKLPFVLPPILLAMAVSAALPANAAQAAPTLASPATAAWWQRLGDPVMEDLVARALAANLDIEQSAARLDRARAASGAVKAALLPRLDASAAAAPQRQSLEDPNIRPVASAFPDFPRNIERYNAGLSASWEIDLFGSSPRLRAARANAAAAAADLAATQIAVAAETASVWVNITELQTRAALARSRLASLERQRTALRLRADAGTLALIDRDRFDAETETAAGLVALFDALVTAEGERLGVLIADPSRARQLVADPVPPPRQRNPQRLDEASISLAARPDVVAATNRLTAARAGVGAARALRLPRLQLGALLATVASAPAALFTAPATAALASAGVNFPLFDFGRINAAVADAKGAERAALAQYQQTLLKAAAEIASATAELSATRTDAGRKAQSAAASERVLSAASASFAAGAADLVDYLEAERRNMAAKEGLVLAEASANRAVITVFRVSASQGAAL